MVRTLDMNQSFSCYRVCIDVTCILSVVWSLFGFIIKVFFFFFRIIVSKLLLIHFYALGITVSIIYLSNCTNMLDNVQCTQK